MRAPLPPWIFPPTNAARFYFNSGATAFAAGADTFVTTVRTQPGRGLRLALVSFSGIALNLANRLRFDGPGCAMWASVPIPLPVGGGANAELPIFLVLPSDTEIDVYHVSAANATRTIRILGWNL